MAVRWPVPVGESGGDPRRRTRDTIPDARVTEPKQSKHASRRPSVGTKLYVGNLNYNTTEDSLRQAFGANGRAVASVSVIMDRETGRSRGFAFVEMTTDEFAQQALQELDGQ